MARTAQSRNTSAPKYRLHKASGQSVVTINGKSIYLGKYNTNQSREQYNRLIAERSKPGTAKPDAVVDIASAEGVTITELAVNYAIESQKYYRKNGKPTSEWEIAQYVLRRPRALYGSMLAIGSITVVVRPLSPCLGVTMTWVNMVRQVFSGHLLICRAVFRCSTFFD